MRNEINSITEIVNNQRKYKIENERWRDFTIKLLRVVKEAKDKSLTVAFISDRKMRELNRTFRGKDKTTDVLSFVAQHEAFEIEALDRTLGDVVISLEQAAKQAKENNLDLDTEIAQLILHGTLHLCGYDHETDNGEMNRLELKLRRRLNIG